MVYKQICNIMMGSDAVQCFLHHATFMSLSNLGLIQYLGALMPQNGGIPQGETVK